MGLCLFVVVATYYVVVGACVCFASSEFILAFDSCKVIYVGSLAGIVWCIINDTTLDERKYYN